MRLQPKKAIQADLATQRKAQIDEGAKIASKVDAVRETLAEEQGRLDRFHKESVLAVQADIDRYIGQRDVLKHEVGTLEQRKAEAQKPLDLAWQDLRQAESRFVREKQAWGEKSDMLDERQLEIERGEKEVESEKQRAKDLKHRASIALAEADKTLQDARKENLSIRNKARVTLDAAEAREKEVALKESELERLKADLEKVQKRQAKKDIEQEAHDRTIKDKYETLARTINRVNKHG